MTKEKLARALANARTTKPKDRTEKQKVLLKANSVLKKAQKLQREGAW
jgi:hypothetical protein